MAFNLSSWIVKKWLRNKVLIHGPDLQVWWLSARSNLGREGGNAQEEELFPKPSPCPGAAVCRASPQAQFRAALRLPCWLDRSLHKCKITPKRMFLTAVFNLVLNDSCTNWASTTHQLKYHLTSMLGNTDLFQCPDNRHCVIDQRVAAEQILLIEFAVWEWSGRYSAAADFFKQQNYEMLQGTNANGQKAVPSTNWEQ